MNALIEKYQLWVFPANGQWYAGQLSTWSYGTDLPMGYIQAAHFRCLETGTSIQEAVERAATVLGWVHPALVGCGSD